MTDFMQIVGVAIAMAGLLLSLVMYVLTRIKEDMRAIEADTQNLFRIKEAINQALNNFRQEVARDYVTFERLKEHATPVNNAVERIEKQLESLSRLNVLITHLAAKLSIDLPKE